MTVTAETVPATSPTLAAFENLPLAQITPSETNPRKRFDPRQQAELIDSIRKHGVLQPILVRPIGGPFDATVYGCGFSPICQELRRLWRDGTLVASVAQEGLIRIRRPKAAG